MLETEVRLIQNPWEHTVPTAEFYDILDQIAEARALHVEKHFGLGNYKRPSFGIALLNPAAPYWMPSSETLLATIAIGPEGQDFIINAIAKAVEHRDTGLMAGHGVYTDLTRTQDGDFCYGYSTQVDGQIAGASAASELQDANEAGHTAVSFVYFIRTKRKKWLDKHPGAHWFCNDDLPRRLYQEMAALPSLAR